MNQLNYGLPTEPRVKVPGLQCSPAKEGGEEESREEGREVQRQQLEEEMDALASRGGGETERDMM